MAAAVMQVDDRASTPTPSIARCVATLEGHEERVWHCAWSRDGTQLASCGSDRSVRLWRRSGDNFVNSATLDDAHDRTVRRVAWAPCGTLLAATSFDATCCVWRRSRQDDAWEILATLEGHENEVKGCAWNASASLLATCSRDKSVWLWEFVDDEAFELLTVLHGHEGDVKTVDFDTCSSLSEDDLLVSCSYDDTLRVWGDDGDDWSCRCTLEGHTSTVWDASFCATSSGARRIVSCGADLSVRVWAEASVGDASKWVQLAVLENVHNRPVYSCAVSGNRIASCGADDALVILSFDVDSGALAKLGRVDACHAGDANAVRWNPACADMLATAGDDGVVRVWRKLIAALAALPLASAFVAPAPAGASVKVQETKADLEALAVKLNPVVGFYDPLGLADADFWGRGNEYTIGWLRHAEIKHGRVAMAGFVGYCLHANGVQFPIHIPGDYSTKSPAELWDQVPEAGKWQIVLFVGFLEFFSESGAAGAHYTKGGKPGAFPSFNSPEAGDQFKIPHPVPLDLWDPVGFTKNASPEKKERGRLIEINNGRLAMLGLFGFLAESKLPGSVPALGGIALPYDGDYMAPFAADFHIF